MIVVKKRSYNLELLELATIQNCLAENKRLKKTGIIKLLNIGNTTFFQRQHKIKKVLWQERLSKVVKYTKLKIEKENNTPHQL